MKTCLLVPSLCLLLFEKQGKGVYVSPFPNYALGYAENGKLIVVAVLLGKSFDIKVRRDGGAW
jgi:hypothetical protein